MDFRPWMLQTAFEFIRGSRLLWDAELTSPSMANVAFGLEVLFKSFNASVDGPVAGIGEQYKVSRKLGHDLLKLFDAIPEVTRDQLGFQTYRDYFTGRMGELFVLARYPYERNGMSSGTNAIIGVAEEMLGCVIGVYKKGGCTDPWVVAYPNV